MNGDKVWIVVLRHHVTLSNELLLSGARLNAAMFCYLNTNIQGVRCRTSYLNQSNYINVLSIDILKLLLIYFIIFIIIENLFSVKM